ncbi:hypothetical protein [Actinomyces minihominis]|nr:hypothetical protein [Actinomyces minihominis]
MKFLGRAALSVVVLGVAVLATSMVMDMMDNDRFWHSVKPGNGK